MWMKIKEKAMERCDNECPICYGPFVFNKKTVLLDCSHVFHANCLENYEKFDRNTNFVSHMQHSCPMCRHQNYKKVEITIN